MPSSIAHAAVAVIANPLLERHDRSPALLWPAAGFAAAPDLDAVGWILSGGEWMPQAHRGVTHSIAAALAASAVIVLLQHRRQPLRSPARAFIYFAVVISSHGLLDSLTIYGDPVALLAPFSDLRYKPFGLLFGGPTSEILCLWLPALLFISLNIGGFRKRPPVTPGLNSSSGAG